MGKRKGKARAHAGWTEAYSDAGASSASAELPTASDEGAIRDLVEEFLGRLDESLIRAIASDYDYVAGNLETIRNHLLPLAESAPAEEESLFHCSDSTVDAHSIRHLAARQYAGFDDDTDEAAVTSSLPGLTLSEVSPTEVTTSPSETSTDDSGNEPFTAPDQCDLSEDDKIESLLEIFNEFQPHTIRFILKESNGHLEKAFDNLLSRKYLLEQGELGKGIDAFAVEDDLIRNQRRSAPRGNEKKSVLPLAYSVKSSAQGEKLLGTGVLSTVEYSTASTHKKNTWQCKATSNTSSTAGSYGPRLRGTLAPAPAVSRASDSASWQLVPSRSKPKPCNRDQSPLFNTSTYLEDVPSHNRRVAGELQRKGGLYSGAAAIYSSRSEGVRALVSREAESMVGRTSTPDQIDLHGVSVMDGVRIAKQRVRAWWDGLDGEDRARRARDCGFTVITGIGLHSHNGVSRLRQAVGVALRNDGWKVETLTGMFCVVGRA